MYTMWVPTYGIKSSRAVGTKLRHRFDKLLIAIIALPITPFLQFYGNVPKRVYHHKQWTGAAPDRLWGWMTLCHWNPAQPFACAFWNILWWHSVWLQMLPLTSVTTPIYICIKVRITAGVTHWSIQSDELYAARTPPLLSQRYLRVTSSQITPSH